MRAWLPAVAFLLLAAAPASAAPQLVEIGRFNAPVHVASPPNDPRVFVVEQGGTIKIAGGGTFLDVTSRTNGGGEEGLLSIAFPPDYATSGRFYVFLTNLDGSALQVVEFQRSAADPNVADPSTARIVHQVPHPLTAGNHNGGQLQFGPDGFLYVSTGDGGNTPDSAQLLSSELGKILRIDARTGAAAPGNPFGSRVWSYGLRNPWRFTFDRATGALLIGDVGEGTWEEVNWAPAPGRGAGANFGWRCREGRHDTGSCTAAGAIDPAFERSHGAGYCAIIGGYVVRDPGLPTLNGRYVYGDQCRGSLQSVVLPEADDRTEPLAISRLSSFGEDACARIYAASLNGPVYRIEDGAASPCPFAAPGPAPTSTSMPVDATAPGLRVKLLRPALRNRRLRLALRCDEPCRAAISARLRGVRRLTTRHRSLAANERTVVALKMSRKTARRARRALNRRGFLRVVVAVSATDAAGNRSAVTRRARIKRRR
jgi:hypothetical protein